MEGCMSMDGKGWMYTILSLLGGALGLYYLIAGLVLQWNGGDMISALTQYVIGFVFMFAAKKFKWMAMAGCCCMHGMEEKKKKR